MRRLSLLLAVLLMASFNAPDAEEQQIMNAASLQAPSFLSKIPAGMEQQYGFSSRTELNSFTIGRPHRVLTFQKDFYDAEVLNSNRGYLQVQNEWRVPVMSNGANKTFVTVVKKEETFKVVDLGGAVLAKEIGQLNSKEAFLLRVYPLSIDFMIDMSNTSNLEEAAYIPLSSAKMAISECSDGKALSLSELKYIVKNHLPAKIK